MKNKILGLALLIPLASMGGTWSLDSCINYANKHSLSVRQAILQRQQAQNDIVSAKDKFLPSIQAGASQSWDFGRGLTSENTYANRNTSAFSYNLGMNLGVFQGLSRLRQVKYQEALMSQIVEQVEGAKEDVTLNVMAQYLQVLYAGEMHTVAQEQLKISQIELGKQEAMLEEGKVPESDVIQARAQVKQDELSIVTTQNDKLLALVNLAKLMELDDMKDFDVEPLASNQSPVKTLDADDVYARALVSNHNILGARAGIAAADKNISLAKTGYFPQLSFNAGLGSSYYRLSGSENPSFGKQMGDNFSKQLGFSLSIPIFDAFSTRNSVRQARTQRLSAELDYDQKSSDLFKAIRQAYYEAVAAEKKLEASKASVEASKAALDAMTAKYEFGRANATEFDTAKTNYIKSLSELTQAKYELTLRRKILDFYNK